MDPAVHHFTVKGMTCTHCVDAITREVIQIDGVQLAHVDLDEGQLWVQGHPEPAIIKHVVEGLGYQVHAK